MNAALKHRHPKQPIGVRLAVIGEPAVVGAIQRRREFRVLDPAEAEAEARIQERSVDTVEVHVGDALVRVETARPTLFVGDRIV
jgi:hypothetical protein